MNGAQQITWFKDSQNISSSITRGRWLIQIFLTNCCCWTNYTVLKTEPSIQSKTTNAQITCSQRPNHVFLTSKSRVIFLTFEVKQNKIWSHGRQCSQPNLLKFLQRLQSVQQEVTRNHFDYDDNTYQTNSVWTWKYRSSRSTELISWSIAG